MKFSDIEQEKWTTLKPYLDTALLPVTGLSGSESPDETTYALEQLRDWLDPIEQQFNGRVVTYPAFHFVNEVHFVDSLNLVALNLREQGFRYIIAVSSKVDLLSDKLDVDAIYAPQTLEELPIYETASYVVLQMWTKKE